MDMLSKPNYYYGIRVVGTVDLNVLDPYWRFGTVLYSIVLRRHKDKMSTLFPLVGHVEDCLPVTLLAEGEFELCHPSDCCCRFAYGSDLCDTV